MRKGKIRHLASNGYGIIEWNGARSAFHVSAAEGKHKEGDTVMFKDKMLQSNLNPRLWATKIVKE